MWPRRLLWQIFLPYVAVILVSLIAVSWFASTALRDFYNDQVAANLKRESFLLRRHMKPLIQEQQWAEIDSMCKQFGSRAGTRITVILPDGRVVGDTERDPVTMDDHSQRPEVLQAVATEVGQAVRYSDTLDVDMMYVAVSLRERGDLVGIVRTSVPLLEIRQGILALYSRIFQGGFIVAIAAAFLALFITRRITRPLEEMKEGAVRLARGDLEYRLPVPESTEIGSLAESMNQMVAQLEDRIRAVVQQRNELEAVLSSMVEGVLAVDLKENLISINRAAATLLGVDGREVFGLPMNKVTGNVDLLQFVSQTLTSANPIESDLIFGEEEERYLQAHGTVLRDDEEKPIGALVVLNDITRLQKLENLRRDFVANVSHEIKTPITSIKGFVETLLDGALDNTQAARRFLGIVAKQADRLNLLITDLLSLSRIEKEEDEGEIQLDLQPVRPSLEAAIQACEPQANEKDIQIDLRCPEDSLAEINAPLLEQAIVNLVDNAIKYSDSHRRVTVETNGNSHELAIRVIDEGYGIAEEHRSRLFERFYRVDKARSRNLGGTGLGLAIVKHISRAHRGRVTVRSRIGKGTTFTIHLPTPEN